MTAALIAISGCNSNKPGAVYTYNSATSPSTNAPLPAPTGAGQPYDFYLLNLSWSPEFCDTHRDSPECAAHPGFVVHGLWPQNNDGTYPEHCPSRPGPTSDADWQGLLPTASLAQHEWQDPWHMYPLRPRRLLRTDPPRVPVRENPHRLHRLRPAPDGATRRHHRPVRAIQPKLPRRKRRPQAAATTTSPPSRSASTRASTPSPARPSAPAAPTT